MKCVICYENETYTTDMWCEQCKYNPKWNRVDFYSNRIEVIYETKELENMNEI